MMNERIKELADQCWINFYAGDYLVTTPDAFAEKFAELIIRECAKLCDDIDKSYTTMWKSKLGPCEDNFIEGSAQGARDCAREIREWGKK